MTTLRRRRAPATFFLPGHFVSTYPAIARAIGRRFVVGNHTVDHAELTRLSSAAVTHEIAGAAIEIRRATGDGTHSLFRFPYGARDARTLAICHRLGYVSVRSGPRARLSLRHVAGRDSASLKRGSPRSEAKSSSFWANSWNRGLSSIARAR